MIYFKFSTILVLLLNCSIVRAVQVSLNASTKYRLVGSTIIVEKITDRRRCSISEAPVDLKLTSDMSALIISGTSYIPMKELENCIEGKIIQPKVAAPDVGFLSDVNLQRGIYTSLVPVEVHPLSFLVIVAKLGSDKNLITLAGSYRANVSIDKLRREAIGEVRPIISIDGNYVAPDTIDCTPNAYPGVWNLNTNKRVIAAHMVCEQLFNQKSDELEQHK